jgi:MFS superfamily sulfate permease-like transporter
MFQVRAWHDAGIMVIVGILTFLLGIEKGIIIAIGISIFMVVKRTTLPRITLLGRTPTGKFKYTLWL